MNSRDRLMSSRKAIHFEIREFKQGIDFRSKNSVERRSNKHRPCETQFRPWECRSKNKSITQKRYGWTFHWKSTIIGTKSTDSWFKHRICHITQKDKLEGGKAGGYSETDLNHTRMNEHMEAKNEQIAKWIHHRVHLLFKRPTKYQHLILRQWTSGRLFLPLCRSAVGRIRGLRI